MQSMYYLENFRTNRLVILKLFTKAKERIEMPKEYLLDTNAYYNLLKESREHQKGNAPDAFPRRGTLVRISGIRDQKPVGTDGKSAAGKS